jgi:type II secretory pathway component PulF
MPYYLCLVCDAAGKKREELFETANKEELLEAFTKDGKFLISHKEASAQNLHGRQSKRRKRFSRELIREFTGIMAALLASGNTVNTSLELCRGMGGPSGKNLSELCSLLLRGIQKGERFSGCLLRSTPSFPGLYVTLVEIGEKTGTTAEVFKRLVSYLAVSRKIRTKIETALFYPAFVLTSAVAGSVLILLFVMPRMAEIYSAFGTIENEIDIGRMYFSVYFILALALLTMGGFLICGFLRRYSQKPQHQLTGCFCACLLRELSLAPLKALT